MKGFGQGNRGTGKIGERERKLRKHKKATWKPNNYYYYYFRNLNKKKEAFK